MGRAARYSRHPLDPRLSHLSHHLGEGRFFGAVGLHSPPSRLRKKPETLMPDVFDRCSGKGVKRGAAGFAAGCSEGSSKNPKRPLAEMLETLRESGRAFGERASSSSAASPLEMLSLPRGGSIRPLWKAWCRSAAVPRSWRIA